MQEVVNIVKYFFKIEFDEDDVYYYRFVTHLKFFAKRLIEHTAYEEDSSDGLWEVIREKYPEAFRCTEKITQFIAGKYEYDLSKEEQLYLTIDRSCKDHRYLPAHRQCGKAMKDFQTEMQQGQSGRIRLVPS